MGLWVWCDYCCEKMAQTRKKHRYYGINTRLSKAEEWPFAYYRVRDKRGVPCKSHWEQFRSKHNSMGMVCPGASQRANYKPNTRHKLCPDHNTKICSSSMVCCKLAVRSMRVVRFARLKPLHPIGVRRYAVSRSSLGKMYPVQNGSSLWYRSS